MDNKCYVEVAKVENPTTKVEQLSDALYCYENEIFDVIYDKSQPALKAHVESFGEDFLKQDEMQFLYFTSGTTGTPTGVYKTKENSRQQAFAFIDTLPKNMKFNRIVTTVPFVHIYGVDIGGVVPKEMDIDVWVKENFIPEELAREAEVEGTLIITTPLFIKALNRIEKDTKFSGSYFVTSTAPLLPSDAKEFHERYDSSVMQLFASTETGMMAYKEDDETILRAYDCVEIGENDNMLNISSPFVAQKVLNDTIQKVVFPFQTEDIVEMLSEHEFKLLGRSSNLAKVAGKRISTLQIEGIVESLDGVDCALVKVRKDEKALRDEILDIYIESQREIKQKELKEELKKVFGSMHIVFKLHNGMIITKSSVGKKIGFKHKE
jgi:acyl-coenzyme A synthetase/AMP-(fatty) acid ligase